MPRPSINLEPYKDEISTLYKSGKSPPTIAMLLGNQYNIQPQMTQFFMPESKFFYIKLASQRTRFYMFFSLKAGIFSLEH
ncbi:hypothetical protein BDV09DRAFT_201603 [Aspergillus tetrazonus]